MTSAAPRILSVNVGQPREIQTRNGPVLTSIFKEPVEGRVAVTGYNLAGDRQADLTVHGGPQKAVYLYPSEHYPYWAKQLNNSAMPFGNFGENLTTAGLDEESVHIGDRFAINSVVLQVTQPRMPCFKLALRFGRSDMTKLFWRSGRSGIYFSIVEEGELGAGDEMVRIATHPGEVRVADVVRLYKGESSDVELMKRAVMSPLASGWKQEIRARLAEAT